MKFKKQKNINNNKFNENNDISNKKWEQQKKILIFLNILVAILVTSKICFTLWNLYESSKTGNIIFNIILPEKILFIISLFASIMLIIFNSKYKHVKYLGTINGIIAIIPLINLISIFFSFSSIKEILNSKYTERKEEYKNQNTANLEVTANKFIKIYKFYFWIRIYKLIITVFLAWFSLFLCIYFLNPKHYISLSLDIIFVLMFLLSPLAIRFYYEKTIYWKNVYEKIQNYTFFNGMSISQINLILDNHYEIFTYHDIRSRSTSLFSMNLDNTLDYADLVSPDNRWNNFLRNGNKRFFYFSITSWLFSRYVKNNFSYDQDYINIYKMRETIPTTQMDISKLKNYFRYSYKKRK